MSNNTLPDSRSRIGPEARRRRKSSKEERVCSVCSQAFRKAEHLARHVRSHTKEKPFECSVCGRVYVREDTLLRHFRSHRTGQESWQEAESPLLFGSQEISHPEREMGSEIVSGQNDNWDSQQTTTAASVGPIQVQVESGALALPHPTIVSNDTSNISMDTESAIHSTPPTTLFSTDGCGDPGNQQNLQPNMWDVRPDRVWQSWLTGVDFDLEAVNLSLLHATSDLVPAMESVPEQGMMGFSEGLGPALECEPGGRQESLIQRKWHTYSEQTPSGCMTPNGSQEHRHIDETYRRRLADSLRQRVQNGILPSTSFLDLCIQAYFSQFHPVFPVIHSPSFRPCTSNSVLLLSICSVGSLYLGSPRATAHGISMFERLNKAILASWETYVSKQGISCITALQASVIGQTFGLLLGRPKDLLGIEVFHGSVIAWARKARLFHWEESEFNVSNLSDDALGAAWKAWISMEEKKRIVLGIHIHDAELAKLHHHEPILRHALERQPRLSSDELFAAPNAMHWKSLMIQTQVKNLAINRSQSPVQRSPVPSVFSFPAVSSDFELCVMLESISASACENRDSATSWAHTAQRCRELLISWYEKYQLGIMHRNNSKSGPMMLWHSTFMLVHADFDALELSCGREGHKATQKAVEYAQAWVKSVDAKRCLLHAVLIQRNFESMPVGTEPSIHVPMCLYYCGIVLFCYLRFGGGGECMMEAEQSLDFPEIRLLGINENNMIVEETGGHQLGRLGSSPLFRLIDLLQRVSHWKLAQSFASTLLALVEKEQDIF